ARESRRRVEMRGPRKPAQKRASCDLQTMVDQSFEFSSAANRIRDRQLQPAALPREQVACFARRQLRSIETDAAAANRGIRALAQAQIQLHGFFDARQRELR